MGETLAPHIRGTCFGTSRVLNIERAPKCSVDSTDNADADSGQVEHGGYERARAQHRVAPVPWRGSSRPGSTRGVPNRASPWRPLWVHRCVLLLLEGVGETASVLRRRDGTS